MTASVTADQIRHRETVGAFEITNVENKRDGTPKAFTVKETQYLESDTAFLSAFWADAKAAAQPSSY